MKAYSYFLLFFLCFMVLSVEAKKHEKKEEGGHDISATDIELLRYEMDPIVLPYIDQKHQKVKYFVIVNYIVKVKNKESLSKLKLWFRRLHDNLLVNVYNYLYLFWKGRGPINEGQLKMLLYDLVSGFLGGDNLDDIIIKNVIINAPVR